MKTKFHFKAIEPMQNLNIRQLHNSSYFDIYVEAVRVGTIQRSEFTKKYTAVSVYSETEISAPVQPNTQAVIYFNDFLEAAEHL